MINKKPIVGAYLLRTGPFGGEPFRYCGRITKVTTATIRYESDSGDTAYISTYSMAAVCETKEEVKKLVEFADKSWSRVVALRKEIDAEAEAFFK